MSGAPKSGHEIAKIDSLVDAILAGGKVKAENDRMTIETLAVLQRGHCIEKPVKLEDLFALEDAILGSSMALEKSAFSGMTRHDFSDGIYIRSLVIPKGMMLTGAIHKLPHMSVLASGDISVLTVDGVKRLRGAAVIQTRPGIKRVGYAHEHTVWMDVLPNPTNEQDVDKLWDMYFHNEKPK